MESNQRLEYLLQCLIKIIGRAVIPPDEVYEVVGTKPKMLKAYNFCDGTATQTEIAKKCGLDRANFNKAVIRWTASGILFKVESGKEVLPLHIYPLQPNKKYKSLVSNKTNKKC